ncbi:MAG: methylated-DNA--[protein]-cysteine S-methyltransferase [Candidatus Marinarcus sp.]|uniref:methylated-DNA--[protein]-cysteine S-methyltransferase n=1 Tax=Candidatus Marinarcus sp. TaxID=3100987 RepID=UPI003B005F82
MRTFSALKKNVITTSVIQTPLGDMFAASSQKGICMLSFYHKFHIDAQLKNLKEKFNADIIRAENDYFETLQLQLNEYFNGQRKEFKIPLQLLGTAFQMQAWKALLNIPYGQTISYEQQASNINHAKAYRAVANANSQNMIAILVPCHRVINKNGQMGGYSGGIDKKEFLLHLERNN